jgi:hypothetical protein
MKSTLESKLMPFAVAAILLCLHGVRAAMVSVASDTNTPGVYRYHVTESADPFRLGGTPDMLSLAVRAYHVDTAAAPPGWLVQLTTNTVTWRYTNSARAVFDTNALTFTLYSGMDAISYNDMAADAVYPRGICAGEVLNSNGVPQTAFDGDLVGTVNMAAYERFPHLGPLVPEPAIALAALLCLGVIRRRA